MNSVIFSGIKLGPHTTVTTGSVFIKIFPNGFYVIDRNPVKVIKQIEKI